MTSTICTLFEGHYHHGLAALVNSLYMHGFRGTIWAGFRGNLPPWATPIRQQGTYFGYNVAEGLAIHFQRLSTEDHFSNYKPTFMLEVWKATGGEAEALFYFDPDIVIRCRWSFFHEWVQCGIALCEDVNSPLPETHPTRVAWRRFYSLSGITMTPRTMLYVNAGFVGAHRRDISFIQRWFELLNVMTLEIGDLREYDFPDKTRDYLFYRPDQDALNVTIEATSTPISLVGQEGMSFKSGGYIMNHAIGSSKKPWTKRFIHEALKSNPPNQADRAYLNFVDAPIRLYSPGEQRSYKWSLKIGAALGRILRRAES